jgi:hypothetical protein
MVEAALGLELLIDAGLQKTSRAAQRLEIYRPAAAWTRHSTRTRQGVVPNRDVSS